MLRAGFCGSGRFAAVCLRLLSEQLKPAWVVTNTPKTSGRGLQLHDTPVSIAAQELEIPCFTTDRLSADTERTEWIVSDAPDIIFVIDFGHLIKEPLLSLPKYGCINLHPSKLPLYRGSAPLQRAIMDGLKTTAVSVFKLDSGMDTGDLLSQPELEISENDTYDSLLERCAEAGCREMLRLIFEVKPDNWKFTPQPQDGFSLAPKIDKSEGRIDWNKSAFACGCLVRALSNAPGVFCFNGDKRLRIFKASVVKSQKTAEPGEIAAIENGEPVIACGENALKLETVQPDSKKQQSAADWLRGARLSVGDRLQ